MRLGSFGPKNNTIEYVSFVFLVIVANFEASVVLLITFNEAMVVLELNTQAGIVKVVAYPNS